MLHRVFLASDLITAEQRMKNAYPDALHGCDSFRDTVAAELSALAKGDLGVFPLRNLDFGTISHFRKAVLHLLSGVLRGETISYGKLGEKAGYPRAGRAIGNVMSINPFPLIIPCHRVVRADGSVGSYQGGTAMKMYLLEVESDRK
ncbi:MAG: MGMT family protein [Candidatus Sabulitectum sp.]|nr:MGMT family protein [Candidatus Sabulitectum sp.]